MFLPIVKIHRYTQDLLQSLGSCVVLTEYCEPAFASLSLERGWQDNKPNISCYPIGEYDLVYEWSDKYQTMLWEVKNVENRSECKFHSANFWHDLEGCTALGTRPKDIDNDGYIDVTSSTQIMKDFHYALRDYTRAKLIVTAEEGLF